MKKKVHRAILRKEVDDGDIIRDYFICRISNIRSADKNDRIIRGWASTSKIDRYGDRIRPEAFRNGIKAYMEKNPVLLLNHDPERPIGKTLEIKIVKDKGLYIKAMIAKDNDDADYAWNLIQQRVLNGLSVCTHNNIKYQSFDMDKESGIRWDIIHWDLAEISVVVIPANPHAIIEEFTEEEEEEIFDE